MRRTNGVYGTEYLLIFVSPSSEVNQPVDRGIDFLFSGTLRCPLQHNLSNKLFSTALEHFANAIQNLPAEICTRFRPAWLRLARHDDRIAKILTAAAAHIGNDVAVLVFEREVASRLSARKLAADINLVGFRDRDALISCSCCHRYAPSFT